MYSTENFKTKKLLKEAVAAWAACEADSRAPAVGLLAVADPALVKMPVAPVTAFQPGGIFPSQTDGVAYLEGPHYPQPHRWYAQVMLANSVVIKVLS